MSETNPSDIVEVVKPTGCALCGELRSAGVGHCTVHAVIDNWPARGHSSPAEAAYSYLAYLDEELGERHPDPLAVVGSACVARLRAGVALEVSALGADRTRLDLLTALALDKRARRGAC